VTPAANADQIRARLKAETRLPEQGQSPETLLAKAADLLFHFSLLNGHPRFWGYVTSSAAPIGCLADLLAAAVNPNVGAWKLAPVATEIELQTIRWIAELIGFPHGTGGLLVSGGNMANFVGFLVGRHSKISSWPSETEGKEVPHFAVYASSETHTWIEEAIDLFGAGMTSLRWVRTDDDQRIDLSELERQIEEDLRGEIVPFMVVGNAGTVGTGAVDPLRELAVICKKHQLWFHVDGAYGALAAVVPGLKAQFDGIDKADSLAVDPHKWLYAPLEAGCALVRDVVLLRETFSHRPAYYHLEEKEVNFFEFGLQNSRGFRAMKVWLGLAQAGREGYSQMISDDIELARELYRLVEANPDLEALSQSLSITTFRYHPRTVPRVGGPEAADYLDRLNRELLDRIERSGEAFLSNALVNGSFALRACVVNFRTTLSDIRFLPEIVVRLGREIEYELEATRSG